MANLWDTAACMELDRFLGARGIRFTAPTLGTTLGSPPGGNGHTDGSNHYPSWWGGPPGSTGQARDFGTNGSDCQAIADALEPYARVGIISELIWTRRLLRTGTYYKRGVAYTPSFRLAWQHRDHVHAALKVGAHLPGVAGPKPVPSPLKGFLMALSDDQQQNLANQVVNIEQWTDPRRGYMNAGRHITKKNQNFVVHWPFMHLVTAEEAQEHKDLGFVAPLPGVEVSDRVFASLHECENALTH